MEQLFLIVPDQVSESAGQSDRRNKIPLCSAFGGRANMPLPQPLEAPNAAASAKLADVVLPGPSWASLMDAEYQHILAGYLKPGIGTRQCCQQMGILVPFVKINFPD